MKVIDQSLDHITVYDFRAGQVRKKIRYESLATVMNSFSAYITPHMQEQHVRLLDEQFFGFYRFDMHFTAIEPCTITHIKSLIDEKVTMICEEHFMDSPYVIHRIRDKKIGNTEVDYILGKTGELSFCLELCILLPDGVRICELLGGTFVFSHPRLSFYPRNRYTIQYLNTSLTQRDYSLLFIEDEMSQLIRVQQGRYTHVTYINIGMQLLKSCYKEHDIEKYFYLARGEIEQNHFLAKLIDEAVSFFTATLSKRVAVHVDVAQPLVVTGDIIQNPSFLPLFQDSYRTLGSGYILPLQALQHDAYAHTFASHEVTVSSYLQYT